jgi:hypothetical protein
MGGFDRQAIYRYVFSTGAFVPVMFQTAGIGFISSALRSLFYLLLYHEVYKYDASPLFRFSRSGPKITVGTKNALREKRNRACTHTRTPLSLKITVDAKNALRMPLII